MKTDRLIARVGLTGGIASGKSTVAKLLRTFGVHVVDADVIARAVISPDSEYFDAGAYAALRDSFGARIIAADGNVDRQLLGEIVFGDDEARTQINQIIHPTIGSASVKAMADAENKTRDEGHVPYIVYDAALLIETGAHRGMAATIVVDSEPSLQLQRIISRDGLTAAQAQARIDAQLPPKARASHATWLVRNNGDKKALAERVASLHQEICRRFSGHHRF